MVAMRIVTLAAVLALAGGAGASAAPAAAPAPPARVPGAPRAVPGAAGGPGVVAELRVGSGTGEVGVRTTPEGDWGVTAFAVGPDGRIHVVDGVNDKLVVLRPDGTLDRELPFPPPLICPEDVQVTEDGIYLMDVAAEPRVVCRLDEDGSLERAWPIPEELSAHAVTGIVVQAADGEDVFLEVEESWAVPLVEDGEAAGGRRLPLVRRGNRADVPAAGASEFGLRTPSSQATYASSLGPDGSREAAVAVFERGKRRRDLGIAASGAIGGVRVLDTDACGGVYVLFDELPPEGGAETRIRRFHADGRPLADLRVPAERFVTRPHKPLRVTPDGSVLCMIPGRRSVTFERLSAEGIEHGEGACAGPAGASGPAAYLSDLARAARRQAAGLRAAAATALRPLQAHAAWDRLDANDRAYEYLDNRWYCSAANFTRSCGDSRPAYITGSGKTYGSVPYCWGGGDTASTFDQAMRDGKDAGDVNCTGSGKRSCTAGVDCSGFVSRLWGLPKLGTYGLEDRSYPIARSSMRGCDIYLIPGTHAIAFRYLTSTGSSAVWEATTTSDKDRVVAWTRSASALAAYGTRRYENW